MHPMPFAPKPGRKRHRVPRCRLRRSLGADSRLRLFQLPLLLLQLLLQCLNAVVRGLLGTLLLTDLLLLVVELILQGIGR